MMRKSVLNFAKHKPMLCTLALLVMLGSVAPAQDRQAPPAAPNATAAQSTIATPAQPQSQSQRADRQASSTATQKRLPADVASHHEIALPDGKLAFQALAGSLPINDGDGNLQAELAYIAYTLAAPAGETRPVTFVFNGGPGASSAYLQLGAVGPWRIELLGVEPSTPPTLTPNPETWLRHTDLVFVDPVATGYSRFIASGEQVRRRFFSIDGDAEALAVFIRKWVEKSSRYRAPKFILGESYGGFRALKVADALRDKQSIGVSGLILVSPVLDFGWRGTGSHSPLAYVSRLPSMAAAARERKAPFNREALHEVERYAAGEYLADLMKGQRDAHAITRMSARVAAFLGLDPVLVRRHLGRLDLRTFQRELRRDEGLITSMYDATVTAFDPDPGSGQSRFRDPVLGGIAAPLTAAAGALYRDHLKWTIEEPYRLLNNEVSSQWNWGRGRTAPEAVDELRSLLAADKRLWVLVAHGATDLVTPYFENQLILDQLPAFGEPRRFALSVYGGGHMFYDREASRRAFRDDAVALMRRAMAAD